MKNNDLLIHRARVKKYVLDCASLRAHKFTRVGADFFVLCDAHLKNYIKEYVTRLPSVGKTVK